MKIQRTLPPTATPLQLADIVSGLRGAVDGPRSLSQLEASLREHFGVKYVFLVSSGKAALTLVLLALKSFSKARNVILPAYTCFSVPSAVLRAGLNVSVCDVDPDTLGFNYGALARLVNQDTLCVLPTHLFGIPSNIASVREVCRSTNTIVVEDAAQAMGSSENGKLLGTLGDVGFFSLGRGKTISSGSGGIIVTNSDPIGLAIEQAYRSLRPIGRGKAIANLIEVMATYCFIHPFLYWIPAGLPFLKLGETRFDTTFDLHRMDGMRAGLLKHWRRRLADGNRRRIEASQVMRTLVQELGFSLPPFSRHTYPYLRLPVLVHNRETKVSLCSFGKERGLGVSPSYPSAITQIPELRQQLSGVSCPGADLLADCLATFPVHPRMCAEDYNRIREMLAHWWTVARSNGNIKTPMESAPRA